jgi:hypothetical protein
VSENGLYTSNGHFNRDKDDSPVDLRDNFPITYAQQIKIKKISHRFTIIIPLQKLKILAIHCSIIIFP